MFIGHAEVRVSGEGIHDLLLRRCEVTGCHGVSLEIAYILAAAEVRPKCFEACCRPRATNRSSRMRLDKIQWSAEPST